MDLRISSKAMVWSAITAFSPLINSGSSFSQDDKTETKRNERAITKDIFFMAALLICIEVFNTLTSTGKK
jgi:hypothetical protein